MSQTTIQFKNKESGDWKKAPVGFSFTVLLFGWWVSLFRRDWKSVVLIPLVYFAVLFTSATIAPNFSDPTTPVLFIYGAVRTALAMSYNKIYIKSLISKGYAVSSVENGDIQFMEKKLGITLPSVEEPIPVQNISSPNGNSLQELEKLGELKEKGIISNEEFELKKKQILGSI